MENDIGASGAKAVSVLLETNTTLIKLNLSRDDEIERNRRRKKY